MKREIKFRGKRTDNGEWEEGYLVQWKCWTGGKWVIHCGIVSTGWCNMPPDKCVEVDPETVEQFTGLKDKNGKEIFEGDICRHPVKAFPFPVEFRDGGFAIWHSMGCNYDLTNSICKDIEIIGNLHDNQNLLK